MYQRSVSKRRGSTGTAASLLWSCLLLVGCPQFLPDDFRIRGAAGNGGAANAGAAGAASSGAGASGASGAGGQGPLVCSAPTPNACGAECRACCDDTHCGRGKVCSAGLCVPVCDAPRSLCVDHCVNLDNDADNCGQCGIDCGPGRNCATGVCTPGWVAMAPPPGSLVARERPAYTAMDGKVFIWGGADSAGVALQSGAIYDPSSNHWTDVTIDANTPSARASAAALWTGTEILVWGGGDGDDKTDYDDGARYDPASKEWQPMTTDGAPNNRRAPYVFWTGSQMLLWSGFSKNRDAIEPQKVYSYAPATNSWGSGDTGGSVPPDDLTGASVAWTGSVLYVYGGYGDDSEQDTLFEYDPVTTDWSDRGSGPGARHNAFGGWDGSAFFIWGGLNAAATLADGQRWVPDAQGSTGGTWHDVAPNLAQGRAAGHREIGWTVSVAPGKTLMVGAGGNLASYEDDAVSYDANTSTWTEHGAWPSGALHLFGVGAWTGSEFVLWGGRPQAGVDPTSQGERLRP